MDVFTRVLLLYIYPIPTRPYWSEIRNKVFPIPLYLRYRATYYAGYMATFPYMNKRGLQWITMWRDYFPSLSYQPIADTEILNIPQRPYRPYIRSEKNLVQIYFQISSASENGPYQANGS